MRRLEAIISFKLPESRSSTFRCLLPTPVIQHLALSADEKNETVGFWLNELGVNLELPTRQGRPHGVLQISLDAIKKQLARFKGNVLKGEAAIQFLRDSAAIQAAKTRRVGERGQGRHHRAERDYVLSDALIRKSTRSSPSLRGAITQALLQDPDIAKALTRADGSGEEAIVKYVNRQIRAAKR